MGFIELGFLDDGITIPGSFNKHGRHYDEKDHYKAIDAAIRGKSTKAGRERGFGLSSNVEMFRDLGQILIVSGYGAIYVDGQNITHYRLTPNNKMDGTLISLRVKDISRIVNIYEYLERATK